MLEPIWSSAAAKFYELLTLFSDARARHRQLLLLLVAAVERLKAAHRASLAEIDVLCASLQHRAFRGEF